MAHSPNCTRHQANTQRLNSPLCPLQPQIANRLAYASARDTQETKLRPCAVSRTLAPRLTPLGSPLALQQPDPTPTRRHTCDSTLRLPCPPVRA